MTDPRIDKIARDLAQVISDQADELLAANPDADALETALGRARTQRDEARAERDQLAEELAELRDTIHDNATMPEPANHDNLAKLEPAYVLSRRIGDLELTTSRLLGTLAGRVDQLERTASDNADFLDALDQRLQPVERAFAIIPDTEGTSD